MKKFLEVTVAMIFIMSSYWAGAQVMKGMPTLLPPELMRNATASKIEIVSTPGSLLIFDMTKTYVNVGKLRSTPVKTDVETVHRVHEQVNSLDLAGGTWNTIFRGGKEFSSDKFNAAGEQNRVIEYSMKLKKEIAATISAVVYHNYSGTVRKRTTTSSSSTVVTNYQDTVAARAIIVFPGSQSELVFESIAIRGATVSFNGKITFKDKEYILEPADDSGIMPFKISLAAQCIAGVEKSMFSTDLFLSNDLDEELKLALSSVVGFQIQVFEVANASRLED